MVLLLQPRPLSTTPQLRPRFTPPLLRLLTTPPQLLYTTPQLRLRSTPPQLRLLSTPPLLRPRFTPPLLLPTLPQFPYLSQLTRLQLRPVTSPCPLATAVKKELSVQTTAVMKRVIMKWSCMSLPYV